MWFQFIKLQNFVLLFTLTTVTLMIQPSENNSAQDKWDLLLAKGRTRALQDHTESIQHRLKNEAQRIIKGQSLYALYYTNEIIRQNPTFLSQFQNLRGIPNLSRTKIPVPENVYPFVIEAQKNQLRKQFQDTNSIQAHNVQAAEQHAQEHIYLNLPELCPPEFQPPSSHHIQSSNQ
jgi:hypothetical protein